MLFEHLCEHAFGRFRHVMRILKNELFRAIFIDYDANATLAAAVERRDPRAFCYLPPGTVLPSFDQSVLGVGGGDGKAGTSKAPTGLFGYGVVRVWGWGTRCVGESVLFVETFYHRFRTCHLSLFLVLSAYL